MQIASLIAGTSDRSGQPPHDPLPLIDLDRRLCLLFSNKAGCTTLTKWFFQQTGRLAAALRYHPWVHRYRIEVYLGEPGYREALAQIHRPDLHRAKLVRSPYSRAVSAYLHAIRSTYADYALSEFLGRAINAVSRFSFAEFVRYLESCDITCCDPHFRQQCSPAEQSGDLQIDRLMRLESLQSDLAGLEASLGLPSTDLESLSRSPHHNRRESASGEFCGQRVFSSNRRGYPPFHDFYDENLRSRVHHLYAADFARYDYAPELG